MTFVSIAVLAFAAAFAVAARLDRILAKAAGVLWPAQLFRVAGEAAAVAGPAAGKLDINAANAFAVGAAAVGAAADRTAFIKRAIDFAASLGLLVGLAPLLVLTALAVRIDSPGPVLYRQKRIGFRGRTFEVFKFRSMTVDAEKNGPQYASADDARVTRVGRLIRKTRIDEIPQAINVLRGEMSFVGPRPERPEFVAVLEREIAHYHLRHLVKPGITGWAQVKYEYAASVEGAREKLRYDLYYIRHFTPLMDIWIILMTVRVALFGVGSR